MTGSQVASNPNRPGQSPAGNAARARYYEAANSWAEDTHATLRKSRTTARIVASVAVGIAAIQGVALVVLIPLKQTIPYTITVDRETGYVQTTSGVNLGTLSESQAVAQSFVVQYVLARETFDTTDFRELYRKTLAWSQGPAEAEYLRDWSESNPAGIRSRVTPNTRVQVIVKSVTILTPKTAMIRFDTERSDGGGAPGTRQPWVASVSYSFSGKPISEQDRYLNPLGFQISNYRRDAETPEPIALPQPMPAPQMQPLPAPVTGGPNGVTTLPVPGAPVGAAPATSATPAASPQERPNP